MLYKLRNIIFYCGALFLATSISATPVPAAQSQGSSQKTATTAAILAVNDSSKQVISTNINLADIATLQKVKGMSKKKAQAIVEYRDKNGLFKSLEDLLKVDCRGIHKKWLDKVSKFLTV